MNIMAWFIERFSKQRSDVDKTDLPPLRGHEIDRLEKRSFAAIEAITQAEADVIRDERTQRGN